MSLIGLRALASLVYPHLLLNIALWISSPLLLLSPYLLSSLSNHLGSSCSLFYLSVFAVTSRDVCERLILLLFCSVVLCSVIGFSSLEGASSCMPNSCTPTQVSNSNFTATGSITGVTGQVSNSVVCEWHRLSDVVLKVEFITLCVLLEFITLCVLLSARY